MRGDNPIGDLHIRIDTARLQALHLTPDTLNVSLSSHVHIDDLSPDNINAMFRADSIRLTVKQQHIFMDSVVARATGANGKQQLTVRSPMLDANADGVFQYNNLYPSLLNYVNGYYHFLKTTPGQTPPQQVVFDGILREHLLVKTFVAGLGKYDSLTFKGSYASDAADSALNLSVKIPSLLYKENKIASGNINIQSANEQLDYSIEADTIHTQDIQLFASRIKGYLAKDTFNVDAVTKDDKGKDRYAIGATASIFDETYTIRLKDKLMLNYQDWNVAADNALCVFAERNPSK